MRGDQIYVIREFLNLQGVYEHHGIDYGDGSVIHYRKTNETISRTAMATFSQGRKIYVKQYQTCFIPDVVIHRAESRLGEREYNLLFNNCEHFATWCKTGISESQQIKDVLPIVSRINVEELYQPIKQALQGASRTNQEEALPLLNQALAEIKVVWDRLQPQYNQAVEEMNTWHQVAQQALQQGREDLARAAIQRKLSYKQEATELKAKLDQLAKMTETLIRNRTSIN
ncbi:MAG: NC domain-containing protein [Symploca sp. SIO2C1]|nr:NC domain-containing protein [Symploca sp. SIO2C1]